MAGDRDSAFDRDQIEDRTLRQLDLDMTTDPTDGQILKINMPTGDFTAIDQPSGGSGESVTKSINQTTHGFSVGNAIRHNGTIYVKAQADSDTNAESIGVVSTVADVDNFTVTTEGYITGLSGLTAGESHFLDETTTGLITANVPTADAEVIKPVLIADSTTSGYVVNMRGTVIGSNIADDLSLAGQAAEDVLIFDGTNWVAQGDTEIVFVAETSRDISLATGTQAITGVGFKPKAVHFHAVLNGQLDGCWGFDNGVTAKGIVMNVGGANLQWQNISSMLVEPVTNQIYKGSIQSFDSDGFTISWIKTNSPTGILRIVFMVFR